MAFLAAASVIFLLIVVVYALLIGTYREPGAQVMGHNLLGDPIYSPRRSSLYQPRAPIWIAPEQYSQRDAEIGVSIALGLMAGGMFWLFQYWESGWLRYVALLISVCLMCGAFSSLYDWWLVWNFNNYQRPRVGQFLRVLGLLALVAGAAAGVWVGWQPLVGELGLGGFQTPRADTQSW